MELTFTPGMKWMIGLLAASFVGLGSWLGVVVYRNRHQPEVTLPVSVATELPAPLACALIEPPLPTASQSALPPAVMSGATTSLPASRQSSLVSTSSSVKPVTQATLVTTTATAPAEPTLSASITTTSANGQTTVTVVANQPVIAGFDRASGSSFSTTQTLQFSGATGPRTVEVRSRGGQTVRFVVAGSSTNSASTTSNLGTSSTSSTSAASSSTSTGSASATAS